MQLDKITVYLLLGSNLGDREKYLFDALKLIDQRAGKVMQTSSLYETAAWGKTDQPSFLNVAAKIETKLNPIQLLETCLNIEADLGRMRYEKWGPRLIDIDIILYGDEIVENGNQLQIPHREMQNRRFVLLPLTEIAAPVIHPVLNLTISELLANLEDDSSVLIKNEFK